MIIAWNGAHPHLPYIRTPATIQYFSPGWGKPGVPGSSTSTNTRPTASNLSNIRKIDLFAAYVVPTPYKNNSYKRSNAQQKLCFIISICFTSHIKYFKLLLKQITVPSGAAISRSHNKLGMLNPAMAGSGFFIDFIANPHGTKITCTMPQKSE